MARRRMAFMLFALLFSILTLVPVFSNGQDEKGKGPVTLKFYTDQPPGQPDPNTGVVRQEFANIAKAYEKLHPNVKIDFIIQPWTSEQDMRTWHLTQLSAGTVPDVMKTQPNWVREDLGKDWWIPMDSYLKEKSPYNTKYATWEESFYPTNLNAWKLADDHRYTICTDAVQTVLYYNKDVYKKLGYSEPKTWSELMAQAKGIKEAGLTPFAWNLSDLNQLTWTSGWFSTFILYDRVPEFDQNGDGHVSDWELAKAIREGKFKATDPGYKDCLRLMSEMSQYWAPSCIGATNPTNYRDWATGNAVIYESGTWDYYGISKDPLRKFEFGAFYYPRLTKADSKFINRDDIPMNNIAAGYGTTFSVPSITKKRGTLDIAIDWLRFITTPENQTALCKEAYLLPNVKGAVGQPILKDIVPTLGYPLYVFEEEDVWLTIEFGTKYLQYWQDVYNGKINLDQAAEGMQKDLLIAADKVWEIHEKATEKK